MNRKQLIVTSVLVMSILILVITQGFFNDNFERINTAEKETSQFTQYKLNVDDYCIVLPNEWAVKESGSDGYISCELKFTGYNDNITGIVEVINTKENIKAFAEKDVKNGYVMWPIRTAVSGMQMTPAGATEIMEILGKEESIKRIKKGISLLENA